MRLPKMTGPNETGRAVARKQGSRNCSGTGMGISFRLTSRLRVGQATWDNFKRGVSKELGHRRVERRGSRRASQESEVHGPCHPIPGARDGRGSCYWIRGDFFHLPLRGKQGPDNPDARPAHGRTNRAPRWRLPFNITGSLQFGFFTPLSLLGGSLTRASRARNALIAASQCSEPETLPSSFCSRAPTEYLRGAAALSRRLVA